MIACFCFYPFVKDRVVVVLGWWRDGVVSVDDGHDVEADELGERAEKIPLGLLVAEVGGGHQDLRQLDAVLSEHGVVQRHQAGLAHGGGGARLYERVRVLDHVTINLQLVPLHSIYKQTYVC